MKKTAYLLVPSALFLLILSACGTSSEAESEQAPAEEVNVTEETAAEETETQKEGEAQEESETAAANEEEADTAASAEEAQSTENDESGENESSADNSSTENAAEETAPETEASVSESEEADQSSENTVEKETNAPEEENTMEEADGVTETVTLYFSDDQLMETLTEERSVTADTKENLPAAALEAWIAGPESEGMFSPVNADTTVQYVESDGSQATVSFSSAFAESNVGSSGDAAIMEQIASIMSQFGYSSTQLLIEGETNTSIFGHVDTSSPIKAGE
ncbi:GerMN domain-containing protein [Sinobaca sp. H24]|uniref:GerMN domain-containing protein n=1 Tax=Sinobaca sp. H24 TaxID=2923376 RepID=UPI0020795B9F|nr:GerMN domain-containing protein [Sinobaca sp. H24]